MNRKKKLAILASCMVMYSAEFAAVGLAEEAANTENGIVLEEVVVSASRFKQLNPVKFTVITEEEIKAKGAQNAAEALNDVTGLFVTSNSSKGKAAAQIRGSDADNTRIFVDGVPLSPVADGKVDLRAIPADNIAKIEVIKGAVPVIYGSDAPGGVIYITTKKADGKIAKSLSIATGSNNDEKYFLTFGGQKGKVNYNLSAKHEKTDGYTDHSREEADYYSGKLSWDLGPKDSVTVFGSYSERKEEYPNRIDPVTGQIVTNRGQGGTVSGKNSYWSGTYDWEADPIKNTYLGAMYNHKIDNKNNLSLKIYQSNEKSHTKAYGWAWWEQSSDHLAHQYWDGTVKGWELQHTIKTSGSNTATWGYSYETRDFTEQSSSDNNTQNTADYDYTGKSFYLQDVTQVNRKLSTSLGYRHYENTDYADIHTLAYYFPDPVHGSGTADDPVFSFNYALSDKTNVHGSIGKSFRWPNAKERSGPGGVYGAPTIVDTNTTPNTGNGLGPDGMGKVCDYLEPEVATNRELGIGYTSQGLSMDVTFFNRDITNMIKGQGFSQRHTQYYNIPHVDMQGYEVEVNKKIRNGLKVFANYSYTDALDPLMQAQVRDISRQKYSLGVNYKGEDGVNANLAVNYIGARSSAFSNGNGNGNGDQPTRVLIQNLPSYYAVDLKVSKEKANRDYYVKIANLFDKEYYNGCYLIAPGRYVEVGTTIKF
jgi:outer membrane receptor protein involved in Fe transport